MIVMCFDTETTGLVNRKMPASHPSQPDLVQLAAHVFDDETGRVYGQLNMIIKPEGRFIVPPEPAAVHGITTEVAEQYGVPLLVAMAAFNNMTKYADAFLGHNLAFDVTVMTRAYTIVKKPHPFDSKPGICTKEGMEPIMQLPPTERMKQFGYGHKFKPPNLAEAYAFAMNGQTFDGSHDASVDVMATVKVYEWMRAAQMQQAAE